MSLTETADAVARSIAVETAIEALHQHGVPVKTQVLAEFDERDWDAEAQLDLWAGKYMRNIAAHYHEILGTPHIGLLEGLAPGVPAAVVGAGPSLDKNAEELRAFPGLVIATDRAAKALVARGITPDLVVTVDPHLHVIAAMLDYPGNEASALVASVMVDPAVHAAWRGPKLYMSSLNPGTQFHDRILPELFPGMPALYSMGNVGNTGVQLAHWMGCGTIVLVGQDYGYTDGRMHADEWYPIENPGDCDCADWDSDHWHMKKTDHAAKLAARTGKVVVDGVTTYAPYLTYRDALYQAAAVWKLNLINATEGGILTALPQARLVEVRERLRDQERAAREARILLWKKLRGEP